MPLFKVVAHDRAVKKFIIASTLTELVQKAKDKLILQGDDLKVVIDSDGTEIDDDDVLLELAQANRDAITMMILENDQCWSIAVSVDPVESIEKSSVEDLNNTATNTEASASQAAATTRHLSLWDKFSTHLIDTCKAFKTPEPSQKRSMIKTIVDYMIYDLKDTQRKTVNAIAKQIVEMYPKSFQDTIDGKVIGTGHESLRVSIYNAIMYQKELLPKKRIAEDIDEEVENAAECPIPRKHDEYGCAEYQPLLAQSQTRESQEAKRMQLIELYEAQNDSDREMCLIVFEETYPTQRQAITPPKRNLEQVFIRWPHLRHSTFLLAHASRLLGKPLKEVWDVALLEKAKTIVEFLRVSYTKQVKKMKPETEPSPAAKVALHGLELIKNAKQAAIAGRNTTPKIAVVFPLLANHFKEDVNFLYKVSKDETDEIIKEETGPFPTLIIKGESFFDDEATYKILIEKTSFISVDCFLECFLILVATYYVFGYQYVPELAATLEFLQRVFLKINPALGQKQAKKRKSVSYDPKVFKFIKALEAYEAEVAENN